MPPAASSGSTGCSLVSTTGFSTGPSVPGRRYAVSLLTPHAGERILEVGVGTGLSLPLYPNGCDVVGIDISDPMLDRARARLSGLDHANVVLKRMDARKIAYPDGHFDKVLAPYVISVVPDPSRVMAEMARVCRPGGTVIVVNHFQSTFAPLAALEHLITPLSTWIGFRMDLPVAAVTGTPGLTLRPDQAREPVRALAASGVPPGLISARDRGGASAARARALLTSCSAVSRSTRRICSMTSEN